MQRIQHEIFMEIVNAQYPVGDIFGNSPWGGNYMETRGYVKYPLNGYFVKFTGIPIFFAV